MNLKSHKKFLKKNILLQRNLENFLTWREFKFQSKSNNFQLFKLKKNQNSKFQQDFISIRNSAVFLKKSKSFYKPISVNLSKKYFSIADFFPNKKAFMNFWIFPLFGGCFFCLTNNPEKTFQFSNFFLVQTPQNFRFLNENSKINTPLKNENQKFNLELLLNKLESIQDEKTCCTNFTEKNIQNDIQKRNLSLSTNLEFENLCLFYLKLTNENLMHSSKKFQNSFSVENLLTSHYFKNSGIEFNWIWHPLNISKNQALFWDKKFSSTVSLKSLNFNENSDFIRSQILNFPQKLENYLYSNDFDNLLRNGNQQPNVSYIKASSLLDKWIKNNYEQLENSRNLSNFNFDKNLLNQLYCLEKSLINEPIEKNRLISYFYNLLNNLNLIQTKVEKFYGSSNQNFQKTIYFFEKFENKSKKIPSSQFLNKTKDKIQLNLSQIFLQSHLKDLLKNQLETSKLSKQRHFVKTFLKTSNFPLNSLKNQDSLKSNMIPNTFSDHLKSKFLLNLSKDEFKLKKTKVFILNRIKSLQEFQLLQNHHLNQLENFVDLNSNKNISTKIESFEYQLKSLFYELMILQYWKEFFPDIISLIETQENSLNILLKTFSKFKEFEEKSVLKTNEPNLKKNQSNKNLTDLSLNTQKQLNLYIELKELLHKIEFNSKYNLDKSRKRIQKSQLSNSDFWIYKTPILFSAPICEKNLIVEQNVAKTYLKNTYDFRDFYKSFFFWSESNQKANTLESSSIVLKKDPSKFLNRESFSLFYSFQKVLKENLNNRLHLLSPIQNKTLSLFLNRSFFQNTKKFQINQNLKREKYEKVVVLMPIQNFKKSFNESKNIKILKSKRIFTEPKFNSILQKRKNEKIFRTYLSVKSFEFLEEISSKNRESLQNKNSLFLDKISSKNRENISKYEFISPILKKIKKRIKQKQFFTHENQHFFRIKKQMNFLKSQNLNTMRISKNLSHKKFMVISIQNSRSLLKKLGFVFFKRSDPFLHESELKRLEKKKTLQKKRRLKKLKLENRRRKKRKRFYPRPTYLRFQFYFNFLNTRHSKLEDEMDDSQNKRLLTLTKQEKIQKSNRISKKLLNKFQIRKQKKALTCKEKIYRQNFQKWGNFLTKNLNSERIVFRNLPLFWSMASYHNQEFYKISNQTLTDFERLCWKSYWLRSNLTSYISRIQNSMKKMQKIEKIKQSQNNSKTLLTNFIQIGPLVNQNQKNFQNRNFSYLNIRDNLGISVFANPYFSFFKDIQNRTEYNRLIYERITDEIKNVKSQLNVHGENNPRSYKLGREKTDRTFSKSIWDSLNGINRSISEPKVQPFFFGSAIQDNSLKPFGDLPTLRLLWACSKTNLFNSNQTNFSKTLWSNYKKREQTKNNKTKKFISKILKMSPFNSKNKEKISFSKTEHMCRKIESFGGKIYGKNSKFYLKNLKFQLQKKSGNFLKFSNSSFLNKAKNNFYIEKQNWYGSISTQKSQKYAVNFWWSTNQINPFEDILSFWMFSSLKYPNFQFSNAGHFISKEMFESSQKNFSTREIQKTFLNISFWLCCVLFHVSILFTMLKIPEIRGLAKFQFLLISKLSNIYLISLYSIYDLIKDYKKKTDMLIQKISILSIFESKKNWQVPIEISNQTSFSDKAYPKSLSLILENRFSRQKIERTFFSSSFLDKRENFFEYFFRNNYPLNVKAYNEDTRFKSSLSSKFSHYLISNSVNPSLGGTDSLVFTKNSKKNNWLSSPFTGFLWFNFHNIFIYSKISDKKQIYFKEFSKNANTKKSLTNSKFKKRNQSFSSIIQTNIQFQSILSLGVFYVAKGFLTTFYICLNIFYKILFTLINTMESLLLILYKFFEKPAELMVDWIAEFFLIEWSSDLVTYVPEALDIAAWDSFKKFSRVTRPVAGLGFGFLLQNRFLTLTELFYSCILKPDTDLIVRQKKGIIFWDVWAEILIQAAEKYKMNLSTLNTIKAEQELLIENLLEKKSYEINTTEQFGSGKSIVSESSFLNSELFQTSLGQMKPLMNFLQTSPLNPYFDLSYSSYLSNLKTKQSLFQYLNSDLQLNSMNVLKNKNISSDLFHKNLLTNSSKRWSANQSLTTQGRDTDLFMDIHPSKAFSHIPFLKSYLPAQEILGSLVCEIYSGLFQKKVSKNILLVGSPGPSKSFFIQALAGETELKIVTDNANRYALVQGGVAIGMKLLREVFDSIALHTPCLFLLEDIHLIGERRPMLISDDDNSKTSDSVFGSEQEEVHEKNKLIYQLSRHSISHYKRPYKGDFSLSIPTNHFCYDFFLGVSTPRKRRSGLTFKSPLPIAQLEKTTLGMENANNTFKENQTKASENIFLSSLQISKEQIFAPPATSPFNILLMKEQKKLKPKKFVKEMPWSGFSYDQLMLISKTNYSVRAKVAVLAEMAMNTLSVKLDMITDLLVIIDSVRSNRGFVVFATTHVPSLLDPALRRPGRLDETISLPLLPNLMNRFEIFKTNLNYYQETIDLMDYSLFATGQKQTESEIYQSISKSLLLLLNSKNPEKTVSSTKLKSHFFGLPDFQLFYDYPIYSFSQAFKSSLNLNSTLFNPSKFKKYLSSFSINSDSKMEKFKTTQNFSSLLTEKCLPLNFSGTDKLNYTSLTYSQAGEFLIEALLLHEQITYSSKFLNGFQETDKRLSAEHDIFEGIYGSKKDSTYYLFKLFSGKVTQFFVLNNSPVFMKSYPVLFSTYQTENTLLRKNYWFDQDSLIQTNPAQSSLSENIQNFQTYWQSATVFLETFFQKRYLYNKNSIASKLLFVQDGSPLRESPSPPSSSILMPAKKFENYKRSLKDFIQKPMLTINEKIQIHQKQRFLKLLYNIPVQTSFKTISNQKIGVEKHVSYTNFYNSFKELSYLDLITLKPSSTYSFYKNHFLARHRFSFINQWWNGQLAEHNVETTYLSHVDWRSMFLKSFGDIVIDFPDAEQFYNPRLRRWFLHSKSWNYWFGFEEIRKQEIFDHYIVQSFTKTIDVLHSNRELLDYLAFRFLRYHQVKELDLLTILVRFYKNDFL